MVKLNLTKMKINPTPKVEEQAKEHDNGGSTGISESNGIQVEAQTDGRSGPDPVPEGHGGTHSDSQNDTATSERADGSGLGPSIDQVSDSNIGDTPADSVGPAPSERPRGLLKGLKLGGVKKNVTVPASQSPVAPADDLTALAMSESAGVVPAIDEIGSGYADEIPATAPERKLPEGLDEQQESFVQSLDSMYSILSDPELFGQMIRTIMMELQQNPQYIQLIADDDVAVMIRGMRESMGLARMRKAEKKRPAAGRKSKSPESNEVLDELNALAAGLGGLD